MTEDERKTLEAFAQKHWSDPKNVEAFKQNTDWDFIRGDRWSGKNVTTPEESDRRRKAVGLPTHNELREIYGRKTETQNH